MKKLLYILPILLSLGFKLAAESPGPGTVSKAVQVPFDFSSDAIYQASFTCATPDFNSVFISSPYPASFYGILVTSPTSGAYGYVEIFDGATTTGAARQVAHIPTKTAAQWWFSVSFSSYLGVNNVSVGGSPACISTIYRRR